MHLNPITLSFNGKYQDLESDFINDYNTKSLSHIRTSLFLGLVLYAVFGFLDAALAPEQKTQLWFIRYAVVCPCIFISILLSKIPGFAKYVQACLVFLMILAGSGISIMVAIADPPANYSYYAGVILVLMLSYGFVKARFLWATLSGWINVLFYEIVAIWIVQTPGDVFLNNNFFFISANIIGMLICYSNERYARTNYYMAHQLEMTQKKTMSLNRELEQRVKARTADINQTNERLQKEIEAHKKEKEERKQAQKEKIEAQRTAMEHENYALVGRIAGKMAHDFNNILGIIMGVSELSMMDCSDENTNKNLELILNQTIRGKNLTKNLVAFAKPQDPKQEFFNIIGKIDLALNLMGKDLENIEIKVEHESDLPEMLADPGMIEHALVNFLQNSIHATSKTKHPRIIIRTYYHDKNIYVEIEDNGCGIPEKYLKNIYEPAFTLKGSKDFTGAYKTDIKGTGYGMSNIKKYIEQHNGKIRVESVVDSGTKFTVSLPVTEKELTNQEKIEIQKEKAYFKKYILLVEDEQAIADVQYRVLTQDPCNHTVDTANNGQAAMDLFSQNEYDLISLDYILSGNINGMDVYHHIRGKNKTVPILFISGNIEFLESIKELKQKDIYMDHLSKPCKNIDYVNGINTLFGKVSI